MIHIILIILKILGILLLAILGLLLTFLLAVLLIPVRYRGSGCYDGQGKGELSISWLLHIFSIQLQYEKDFHVTARIFGFQILKPKTADRELEIVEDTMVHAMEVTEEKHTSVKKEKPVEHIEIKKPKIRRVSFFKKIWKKAKEGTVNIFTAMKHFFYKAYDIGKKVKEKKDDVIHWISNEENKKTGKLFLRQGKKLIRHILPKRGEGDVTFGFADPYVTGQVLTYVSVIYPFCYKHFHVYPVFDEEILQAEGRFVGRIRMGSVLAIVIPMVMDKNFRILLKKLL